MKGLESCASDISTIVIQAKNIIEELKSHKPNILQIMKAVETIKNTVKRAKTDCKVTEKL